MHITAQHEITTAPAKGVRSVDTPPPVVVEITPTGVPARELPLGLVGDVRAVLRAHGLEADVLALMQGLRVVVERTPRESGGSAS